METTPIIIISAIASILIYLLARELNCWYWKINKRIALMEENNNLLKKLLKANNVDIGNDTKTSIEIINSIKKEDATSVTIKNKANGEIDTIGLEYWEKKKDLYGEDKYEIISYNK
jgi:hypothetical protein